MMCQILFSRKKNIASLSSAESAHSMISVKVKLFNDCEQTMNTAPDDFFHHEFWYFAYFYMKDKVQSTLVISNSKGLYETLRDIHTSTYQIFGTTENN